MPDLDQIKQGEQGTIASPREEGILGERVDDCPQAIELARNIFGKLRSRHIGQPTEHSMPGHTADFGSTRRDRSSQLRRRAISSAARNGRRSAAASPLARVGPVDDHRFCEASPKHVHRVKVAVAQAVVRLASPQSRRAGHVLGAAHRDVSVAAMLAASRALRPANWTAAMQA